MSDRTPRLHDLVDLAKEPSSEKRRELLRQLCEMYFESPDELSESEISEFGDIMGKIAFAFEIQIRKDLAERISAVKNAPRELVLKLANDEISVARPLLEKSGVLRDADLVDVARRCSRDHLMAISLREKLSDGLCDVLVEEGDDDVLCSLASNEGANLSRGAMEVMVSRAEDNEKLHEPVTKRAGLPPDLLQEMFWHVSSALREYILKETANMDEDVAEELLATTRASLAHGLQQQDFGENPDEAYILRQEKLKQLNETLLVRLLRHGEVSKFVIGFARFTEIDRRMADRVIFDESGEPLAVACKANGFSQSTFSTLVLLLHNPGGKQSQAMLKLLNTYSSLPVSSAQRVMRFWRLRQLSRHKEEDKEGSKQAGPATTVP